MIQFGINTRELESTISLISRVLGIRVTFFDSEGDELKFRSLSEMTRYCTARRQDSGFNGRCIECDRRHLKLAKASRKTQIYHCHDKLIEGIIPLYDYGDIYLGAIVFGQIRDSSVGRKDLRGKLKALHLSLPSYSMVKAEEIGTLLKYVSEYIIHCEIIKRKNLPWADKAESYIGANIGKKSASRHWRGILDIRHLSYSTDSRRTLECLRQNTCYAKR